jgi:Fe-S cluster assembly ATPase SufC
MTKTLLKIEDLRVESQGKKILEDLNLEIKEKEFQAILGPNASGKALWPTSLQGTQNMKLPGEKLFLAEKT